MEDVIWIRTLFETARLAPRMLAELQKAVSAWLTLRRREGGAEREIEAFLELLERRDRTELLLKRSRLLYRRLDTEDAFFIRERLFCRRSMREIAEWTGIPLRTAYRRLDRALRHAVSVAAALGYLDARPFLREQWVRDRYEHLRTGRRQETRLRCGRSRM